MWSPPKPSDRRTESLGDLEPWARSLDVAFPDDPTPTEPPRNSFGMTMNPPRGPARCYTCSRITRLNEQMVKSRASEPGRPVLLCVPCCRLIDIEVTT